MNACACMVLQVWFGATLVIVITVSDFAKAANLDSPHRHTASDAGCILMLQVWYGATPVIVITDADLGKAVNLRNPYRHTAIGPMTILQGKDRVFESEGILLTKKCANTFL
jgi:hypothetical protein